MDNGDRKIWEAILDVSIKKEIDPVKKVKLLKKLVKLLRSDDE